MMLNGTPDAAPVYRGGAESSPRGRDPFRAGSPATPLMPRETRDAAAHAEGPEAGAFLLPGGYVAEDGRAHVEAELKPLTGHDEEFLAHALASPRPVAGVVTALLARCLKRVGTITEVTPALAGDLLAGDRDYLMLKLRAAAFGAQVVAVLRCGDPACGRPMDVKFSLDEIEFERRPVASRFFTMGLSDAATYCDGAGRAQREVEFRLPTGADQEAVAELFAADEERAQDALLARCVRRIGGVVGVDEKAVAGLPPAAWREIEGRIEELAPRAEIELEGVCPECQSPFETAFDFTAFFLAEARGNLSRLERDVHLLAWHYHWSEQDILALTRRKRRRYLQLLQEALEQRELTHRP